MVAHESAQDGCLFVNYSSSCPKHGLHRERLFLQKFFSALQIRSGGARFRRRSAVWQGLFVLCLAPLASPVCCIACATPSATPGHMLMCTGTPPPDSPKSASGLKRANLRAKSSTIPKAAAGYGVTNTLSSFRDGAGGFIDMQAHVLNAFATAVSNDSIR
jgi:hypothetical protein